MTQPTARRSVSGRQLRNQRRERNPILIVGAIAALAIIAAVVYFVAFSSPRAERFADQGNDHLANPSDPVTEAWNSNPPTSGQHWGNGWADPGVKTEPISDTITVHNLEHGYVLIHYRQGLEQETVDRLANVTRQLQQRNPCVIMMPRAADQIDAPIVLTSWTYKLSLQEFNEGTITRFFADHVGRDNPEKICPTGI
jgi:hypothetical protein